jgi:hypothetical protein
MAASSAERVREHRQRKTLEQLSADIQDLAALPEPPTRPELLKVLGMKARNGDSAAIRILLEEYRRDGDSDEGTGSAVDELARRRAG